MDERGGSLGWTTWKFVCGDRKMGIARNGECLWVIREIIVGTEVDGGGLERFWLQIIHKTFRKTQGYPIKIRNFAA